LFLLLREFTLSRWRLSEAALNEPELMRKRFLCVKTPPCEFQHKMHNNCAACKQFGLKAAQLAPKGEKSTFHAAQKEKKSPKFTRQSAADTKQRRAPLCYKTAPENGQRQKF
jgi:hypothetical protein